MTEGLARNGIGMALLTTAKAAKVPGIAAATLNEWRMRNESLAYKKLGRLVPSQVEND